MWLKSATIVGISPKAKFETDPENYVAATFAPPTSAELLRHGFSPVHPDRYLAHAAGKFTLMHFTVAKKHLPASAINDIVAQRAAELEKEQGFPPGKKARKELKERVVDELLPRALTTRSVTPILIDQENHLLWIGTTSQPLVDLIQREMIKLFGDIGLQDPKWPRSTALTNALDDAPAGFSLDDQVTLRYPGATGKVVRFTAANLHEDDVQAHQRAGAGVVSLAMTCGEHISFTITEGYQLRGIKPLDVIKESQRELKDVDRFDGEFLLMTRALSDLYKAITQEIV